MRQKQIIMISALEFQRKISGSIPGAALAILKFYNLCNLEASHHPTSEDASLSDSAFWRDAA